MSGVTDVSLLPVALIRLGALAVAVWLLRRARRLPGRDVGGALPDAG